MCLKKAKLVFYDVKRNEESRSVLADYKNGALSVRLNQISIITIILETSTSKHRPPLRMLKWVLTHNTHDIVSSSNGSGQHNATQHNKSNTHFEGI